MCLSRPVFAAAVIFAVFWALFVTMCMPDGAVFSMNSRHFSKSTTKTNRPLRGRILGFETLERRRVLSATYYVDSVNGNDANNGTSQNSAWATIAKVNSKTLNAGDTVLLKRGSSWNTSLDIHNSGTASAPIIVGAYGSGGAPQVFRLNITGSNTQFEDLLVDHNKQTGDTVLIRGKHVTLRNLEIRNGASDGIDADKADDLLIDHLLIQIAAGLEAVIVNPGFMLGPWDWRPSSGRMLLELAKGWCLIAPPGTNTYCDVRDVASGVLAARDRGTAGRNYIMAGTTLTFMQAWSILAPITGRRPPLRTGIRPTMRLVGRIGDLLARITGRESDVNSAAMEMALSPKNYSSARAAAELGYRTRDLAQSGTDAWNWLKEYGYAK
jgi:hypothetical protein